MHPFCFNSGTNIALRVRSDYSSVAFTVEWDNVADNVPEPTFNQYRVTYSPNHNGRPNAQQSPRIISVSSLGTSGIGSLLLYGLDPGQLYTVTLETLYNGEQTDDALGRLSFRTRNCKSLSVELLLQVLNC